MERVKCSTDLGPALKKQRSIGVPSGCAHGGCERSSRCSVFITRAKYGAFSVVPSFRVTAALGRRRFLFVVDTVGGFYEAAHLCGLRGGSWIRLV